MKTKYPYADASRVAHELHDMLALACEQITIAGSLRRLKTEVGDIELLFVPRMVELPDGLFDSRIVDVCSELVETLLTSGILAKRPNVNGHCIWGPQNKRAIHVASGIPVDLFGTSLANWWVSLVVRTGSKETNLRLTTGANKKGSNLMAYGNGVKWNDGTITPATSEQHVFDMCGVPYLEPQER